ncbi:MAG TPA: ABC transporter permease [Burkholderiaceae bacterium]
MTALLALIRKDLILYFSDRRALLINLLLPIALAAFMGSLFGGSGDKQQGKIALGLVMQDSGKIGAGIVAALKADQTLDVIELDEAQARARVREGKMGAAVVVPAGFGDAAGSAFFNAGGKPEIAVLHDPSQSATLAMVKGILTQHVMQTVSAEMFDGQSGQAFTEKSLAQLKDDKTQESAPLRAFLGSYQTYQASKHKAAAGTPAASAEPKAGLTTPFSTRDEALSSGPKYNGYAHAFAGMGVQFILFFGIDVGIGVLLARRTGIWSRLQAAPVSFATIFVARALSCAIIAFLLLCAIFGAAALIFKVRIAGSFPGFFGVALCFSLMTAFFGLFIAAFGKTPEAARGIAIFATLIMVMLGGAWMPAFLFPAWMQRFTLIMPTRWAVDGFDAMTWRGLGLDVALQSMGVLLGFAVLFGALALWKFKREQR